MVNAQSLDFRKADSISLDLYTKKDWTALQKAGKSALRSDVDYYYLRMRLGIASYEQRNFTSAERHFRKALKFNNYDPIAQSYLTGSILETFRTTEAGSVFNHSLPTAKQYIPVHKGFDLKSLHSDIGMTVRQGNDELGFNELAGEAALYGQQRIYRESRIYDAGTHIQIRPNLICYIGSQWIQTKVTDRFAYVENSLILDSTVVNPLWGTGYYYSIDTTHKAIDFEHQIRQQSTYMQAQWSPGSRLSLTAGGQLIRIRQTNTNATMSSFSASGIAAEYNDTTLEDSLFSTSLSKINFQQDTTLHTDWAISLGATYTFGKITTLIRTNLSSLNGNRIRQLSAGINYLPFGNGDVYSQTEVIALDNSSVTNIIYKEVVGVKILSPLWFEARLLVGNLEYYSDQSAYIVYNVPELVRFRLEPTLYVVLSKHLQLHLRYKYQQSESYYYTSASVGNQLIKNTIETQSNSIIGGIKWIF
jgi:hypothetical protein